MIHEPTALSGEGDALDLDPFAFWPDLKSRLVGLGGEGIGDDPDYAFHTPYVSCGTGPIVFTLKFANLRAERGTLILRLHELPEVIGAHARQVAISQTRLVALIRGDGTVTLPADAREGSHYAILGHIYGDCVAIADGLGIQVARRTPDPHDPAAPTHFHADADRVRAGDRIIGEDVPTLAAPTSQLCTTRQLREPIFRALLDQMGAAAGRLAVDRWEQAYLARVLDRYDAARPTARGIGIGAIGEPVAARLASLGCTLLLTAPADLPARIELPPGASARMVDPYHLEDLPAGFDFAFATRAGGVGGHDRQALLRFIEDALAALKPGGLLTLVVPIDVAPRAIGDDSGPLLRRPDVTRTVLLLLSRGHQVAQLRPFGEAVTTEEGGLAISAFGLIVRKAA